MFNSKKLVLGLVAVFALAIGLNAAIAGEEAPAKAKPAKTTEAPAKAETKTPSPIHTMMKWVAKHVTNGGECADCCPTTEKGEAAWRAWFAKKDAPLATLRDAMVADGWSADKTVGYFKKMAAQKKASSCSAGCECEGCDKGAAGPAADKAKGECEKGCCGGCDKEKAKDGAAGPAADKAKSDCSGCDKSKDCSGCTKGKDGAAGPAADKAKGECEKGCCGGCDKEKAKDGAAGPAADKAKSEECPGCPGK